MAEYPVNLIGLFLSRLFSLKVTFTRPQVGHLVYFIHFPATIYMLKSRKILATIVFSFFFFLGAYRVRLEKLTSNLINFKNYCYNTAYSHSQQWSKYRGTQRLARICLSRHNLKSGKSGNELVAFPSTGSHTTSIYFSILVLFSIFVHIYVFFLVANDHVFLYLPICNFVFHLVN